MISKANRAKNLSHIHISKDGAPEQNIAKVIEMMEDIEALIGREDIVIIKPNAQRPGHGGTNANTIKGFIDPVLNISNFSGEIIIAENHHDDPDNSRGWTTTKRNGDFNLNELIEYYQENGHPNVTKYHWRDGGSNPSPLQFKAGWGGIVSGPEEGDGYVWDDEEYVYRGRRVKMSYPIFTSAFSGITIDFKNGAWKDGRYTGQPVKFINMSTLNHHSGIYAGVTASVKNYLGVIDMTCGEQGPEPKGYYNFHYIALGWPKDTILGSILESLVRSKVVRKSISLTKAIRKIGPVSGAIGGAVGHFMKTIRMADLNIIAAEYAGYEGRWETPAHTRTVLASTDPVALDYYAAKYVLYPQGGSKAELNNPDNKNGIFRQYLELCHAQGIGTLDENQMVIHEYDFKKIV